MNTNDPAEPSQHTTLEDLQAIQDAALAYCYEMEIPIEDANL